MSTGNFLYYNRCIALTNEDYEENNYPELSKKSTLTNRSYPSTDLEEQPSDFYTVVLTAGYYEGGCIDYIQNEETNITDYINLDRPNKEIIKQLAGLLNWSQKKVKEQINNDTLLIQFYKAEDWEKEEIINKLFTSRALEIEAEKVNKFLDEIKKKYGLKEYQTFARFSNGETLYNEI